MSNHDAVILYKFASRSRPDKFFKCLDNIIQFAECPNYYILCSLDEDDASMNNVAVIEKLEKYTDRVVWFFGKSRNKVDAINRDMEFAEKWDILINMSDDMRFLCPGFDKQICDDLYNNFPDGDGVLAYYDQGKDTKGTGLITMAIMGQPYYKRFGYIYFPFYESLHCDNEMTEVGKQLGKYFFSPAIIISHDHPANGIGVMDAQYRKTEDAHVFHRDKALFERRKKKGFYVVRDFPLLSILVCTISSRKAMFERLMAEIKRQIGRLPSYYQNKVHVDFNDDETMIVGTKRNVLVAEALGRFVVFVDDDDIIMPDYVKSIVRAIVSDPTADCIGMDGFITTNGKDLRNWTISNRYGHWYEKDGVYYRTPNHISPIRREIADLIPFPEKNFGEDAEFSAAVLPWLKKETKINKQLYHYDYRTKG